MRTNLGPCFLLLLHLAKTGFPQKIANNIPRLSMTKLTIFHDLLLAQDSRYFWQEIHYWTILETMTSVTIFWTQVRAKFVIFHYHFHIWDSCKSFIRNSWLDNFENYNIWDNILNENRGKIVNSSWLFIFFGFSMPFPWLSMIKIFPWLSMTEGTPL